MIHPDPTAATNCNERTVIHLTHNHVCCCNGPSYRPHRWKIAFYWYNPEYYTNIQDDPAINMTTYGNDSITEFHPGSVEFRVKSRQTLGG